MRRSFFLLVVFVVAVVIGAQGRPPRAGDFPGYGLLPKEDTGALRFLHAHPEYDGRGVVVAIFDTGVDPGAPGLQTTTDGKPKIVDVVDASGSGDVDTSTVVTAEGDTLAGLTGRELTLGDWTCPSGEYHLGIKAGFELFPGGLVSRMRSDRREDWDAIQRAAVTAIERELEAWDAMHPEPTRGQKEKRDELATRLEQLEALQGSYSDPGPIYDCVVFHDGEMWQAVIDTDEDGDLAEEQVMTNYRVKQQWATFSDKDLMNYAVNIYDDGNLLSIVCDSGSHGTHVAGIVAAHFPERPDLNGLAPGAQLVSVKIGDTRLGSASCGTGEVRGCVSVLQNECDLINMSFGGPTADPNAGRTIELYQEIVNKHNVIFVSSAGNEGPALSTAGSPGATTEAIFGIGAYISPEMQEVQYSLREVTPPTRYTFTSRGPTYDGALGIEFTAPGGAVAPVPNWLLQGNAQMHGTSMSSPNACGNIALLLSGLKGEGIDYRPAGVRRAIENTCVAVPGVSPFAAGRGLIQIDRAFDYIKEHGQAIDQDARFEINVSTRDGARGIYLREPFEVDRVTDARVYVSPEFHEDVDSRVKVGYELRCKLESTARWIECADYMLLMHGGRRLDVRVDPTGLAPGAYYEEIRGYDAMNPERGPLFRIPITVIRPVAVLEEEDWTWSETIAFEPGYEERHFMVVPEDATWADLRIRRLDDGGELAVIVLQAVQLVPGDAFSDHEFKRYLRIQPDEEQMHSFAVTGGRTMEICLAEYTGYVDEGELELALEFHGIRPDGAHIALDGSELMTAVRVETPLRKERVGPSGSLNVLRRPLRPTEHVLRPLDGTRDLLPEERQVYELILTYPFTMEKAGRVTPRVALLNITDEKTWQSRIYMIFDERKRLITTGWLNPSPVHLEKGEYTLRFHVRLADRAQLEKLKDMVLMMDHQLGASVGLSFYEDPDAVTFGGGHFGARYMDAGERTKILIGTPDMPGDAQPGDVLVGSMTFGRAPHGTEGVGHRPGGYPVTCVVPPKEKPRKEPAVAEEKDEDEPPKAEQIAEAQRDFKVGQLKALYAETERALFNRIAAEVLADYPQHLPVFVQQLRRAEANRDEDLQAVVDAAERIIEQVDEQALAAHYGVKIDPEDALDERVRREMDEKREALIAALHMKAAALLDLARAARPDEEAETEATAEADEAFEEAFSELRRWVDTTEGEYLALHVEREIRQGDLGEALKLLNARIAEARTERKLYEQRIHLLKRLGWPHWAEYEGAWMLMRFPKAYPPF